MKRIPSEVIWPQGINLGGLIRHVELRPGEIVSREFELGKVSLDEIIMQKLGLRENGRRGKNDWENSLWKIRRVLPDWQTSVRTFLLDITSLHCVEFGPEYLCGQIGNTFGEKIMAPKCSCENTSIYHKYLPDWSSRSRIYHHFYVWVLHIKALDIAVNEFTYYLGQTIRANARRKIDIRKIIMMANREFWEKRIKMTIKNILLVLR